MFKIIYMDIGMLVQINGTYYVQITVLFGACFNLQECIGKAML